MLRLRRLLRYQPFSCRTGKDYTPGGGLMETLIQAAIERGYKHEGWGTLKQIENCNGRLKDGEEEKFICHTFESPNSGTAVTMKVYNGEQLVNPEVMMRRQAKKK